MRQLACARIALHCMRVRLTSGILGCRILIVDVQRECLKDSWRTVTVEQRAKETRLSACLSEQVWRWSGSAMEAGELWFGGERADAPRRGVLH